MLDLDSLKTLKIAELNQVAQELGIQGTSGLKKAGTDIQNSGRTDQSGRIDFF
jgi:hypothetical protein